MVIGMLASLGVAVTRVVIVVTLRFRTGELRELNRGANEIHIYK